MKKILQVIFFIQLISFQLSAQKAGNAIQFDDIDDHIIVPHHPSLNPGTESWSICLWIKPPDIEQRGPLIGKRSEASDFNQYTFGIGNTDPHNPTAGRRIYANYIDTSGISERSGYTQDEFIDGVWHHITFVADKNTDSISFYIDGIKQITIISFNYGKWPDVGRTDPLYIGCNSYVSAFYEGEMDEVSLWNKALSSDQINVVMNDTLSSEYYSTIDSGLVAYYRFDEYEDLGIGSDGADDIRDLSLYGNHGDSEGNPLLVPSGILLSIDDNPLLISEFKLEQNFPNPFNPSTIIKYQVSSISNVSLKVYDVLGNEVATLVNEQKPAGSYEVKFNAAGLSSGIYFYKLQAGSMVETKKMILMK
ncbi:MAG TPA: LamG-like jellyroll fold domain-containing protein [Ignavibacteriaceae bacterium]|nr:LamG-like jellyroll fold domain-containing protein [Ignavibacteriaceae bacterium]